MNLYLENIELDYKNGTRDQTLLFKFKNFQIDNQLFNTPHPIVFFSVLPDKDTDFFFLSFNKSNLHKNITFFNGLQVHMQKFELKVDQAFLTHLIYSLSHIFEYLTPKKTLEDLYGEKETDYTNQTLDVSDLIYFKTLWIGKKKKKKNPKNKNFQKKN